VKSRGRFNLTTLAIVGAGIAAHSLIFTLAKEKKNFSKIFLIDDKNLFPPCTLSSTAVVAARGVNEDLSPLGKLLHEGYQTFKDHFDHDSPEGVKKVIHTQLGRKDDDKFIQRFGTLPETSSFQSFPLTQPYSKYEEEAFIINPAIYLNWLWEKSQGVSRINDAVISVQSNELFFKSGDKLIADQIVFCAGVYQKFFLPELSSKSIQGAYLESHHQLKDRASFSLTVDGINLIYHHDLSMILLGSTSKEAFHFLASQDELKKILTKARREVSDLPPYESWKIRVGLREKAKKRMPYCIRDQEGRIFLGGYYKNGFSVALKMAKNLTHQFL